MKYVAVLLGLVCALAWGVQSRTRFVELPTSVTEPYFPITAKLSGYPLPVERPLIVVTDDQSFFEKEAEEGYVVYDLYDIDPTEPDVIYINALTPAAEQSTVLVHEIVHWLQEKAGKMAVTCLEVKAVEIEAYTVDYVFAQLYIGNTATLDIPKFPC